ncbi:hypothetical protein Q8A73_007077 [Channa argus]|nr:hypothetical protein Q8A73_007077 [Channa argus]
MEDVPADVETTNYSETGDAVLNGAQSCERLTVPPLRSPPNTWGVDILPQPSASHNAFRRDCWADVSMVLKRMNYGYGNVRQTWRLNVKSTHMTEQLAESGLIWNCHQPLVKCSVRVGREHGSVRAQPIHNQTLGTVHTSCGLQSSLFIECVGVWVYVGYMPKLDPSMIYSIRAPSLSLFL